MISYLVKRIVHDLKGILFNVDIQFSLSPDKTDTLYRDYLLFYLLDRRSTKDSKLPLFTNSELTFRFSYAVHVAMNDNEAYLDVFVNVEKLVSYFTSSFTLPFPVTIEVKDNSDELTPEGQYLHQIDVTISSQVNSKCWDELAKTSEKLNYKQIDLTVKAKAEETI
jgi:hypothetical protein